MKIVDVSLDYDPTIPTVEEQLRQHYTSVGWNEALARKGTDVIAIKRFKEDASFERNGVHYYFLKDGFNGSLKTWQIPVKLFRKVRSLNPDVVHLHNLSLSLHSFLLRRFLSRRTAIVVQHHGGPTPVSRKKKMHDFFNAAADAYFFTTEKQGQEWFPARKFHHKIRTVMEGSTFFDFDQRVESRYLHYEERASSRNQARMEGHPIFLWVGRLDENKDPLTVLYGLEEVFQRLPAATLYMIFSEQKNLKEVEATINASAILKARVKLLGKIDHRSIEPYFKSADYFVGGSHYEGSGYALSEALRCGCIPIVTDIASFNMMTMGGKLGALWIPGDKDSLIAAIDTATGKPRQQESEACMRFFKDNLSFDAIAGKAMIHYKELAGQRRRY